MQNLANNGFLKLDQNAGRRFYSPQNSSFLVFKDEYKFLISLPTKNMQKNCGDAKIYTITLFWLLLSFKCIKLRTKKLRSKLFSNSDRHWSNLQKFVWYQALQFSLKSQRGTHHKASCLDFFSYCSFGAMIIKTHLQQLHLYIICFQWNVEASWVHQLTFALRLSSVRLLLRLEQSEQLMKSF